jgi:hypothetical protein
VLSGGAVGAFIGYVTKKLFSVIINALKLLGEIVLASFVAGIVFCLGLISLVLSRSGQSSQFASALEQGTMTEAQSLYGWLIGTGIPWITGVVTVYGAEAWNWLTTLVQSAGPFVGTFGLTCLTAFAVAFKKTKGVTL